MHIATKVVNLIYAQKTPKLQHCIKCSDLMVLSTSTPFM